MTTKERKRPITAVTRNGKSCGNITFTFRKKFSSSRKISVTYFATSCSCKPSGCEKTSFPLKNSRIFVLPQPK